MRHLLLGMALVLSAQSIQAYAEDNHSFNLKNSLVQEANLENLDVDSLARSKSSSSYSLPKEGESLLSTSAYAITTAGTLIPASDRMLSLTMVARHNKKGVYEINISSADALLPSFSHNFLIARLGDGYVGQSTDSTATAIYLLQTGRDLEVAISYIDPTTTTLSQARATFRLTR